MSNTPSSAATTPVPVKVRSWADECDEDEDEKPVLIDLPTGPRASRIFDDETVPQHGPFMAHLTNLPYEINEFDIQEFFGHLNVLSVRLPVHDNDPNRIRGFGFVEFETRDDLIDAISTPDPTLRNRRFRIDISNENDQKRNSRYDKGNRYDNFGAENSSNSNWRQRADGALSNEKDGDNRRGGGYGYNKERNRDGERDRDSSDAGGNWRSGDRPVDSPPPQRKQFSGSDRYGGDRVQRNERGDRGDRGERGDRGDRGDRGERGGRGGYYENRGNRRDEEPELPPERPKIVLQPRTLPLPKPEIIEDEDAPTTDSEHINEDAFHNEEVEEVKPKPQPIPAEKIFGSAKPVDTAAREREIEERLAERERERKQREAEEREKEKEEKEKEKESQRAAAAAAADALAESNLDDEKNDKENVVEKETEVISWRRTADDKDNNSGNDEKRRNHSPSNRRYSPDRRGGPPKRNGRRCL